MTRVLLALLLMMSAQLARATSYGIPWMETAILIWDGQVAAVMEGRQPVILDLATGEEIWVGERPEGVTVKQLALVDGRPVMLLQDWRSRSVRCVDMRSGEPLWERKSPARHATMQVATATQAVVVLRDTAASGGTELSVHDMADGRERFSLNRILEPWKQGMRYQTGIGFGMELDQDELLSLSPTLRFRRYDLDGELLGEGDDAGAYRLAALRAAFPGETSDNWVLYPDGPPKDGFVETDWIAADPGQGRVLWDAGRSRLLLKQADQPAQGYTIEEAYWHRRFSVAPMVLATTPDAVVMADSGSSLSCFDPATGELRWAYLASSSIGGRPLPDGLLRRRVMHASYLGKYLHRRWFAHTMADYLRTRRIVPDASAAAPVQAPVIRWATPYRQGQRGLLWRALALGLLEGLILAGGVWLIRGVRRESSLRPGAWFAVTAVIGAAYLAMPRSHPFSAWLLVGMLVAVVVTAVPSLLRRIRQRQAQVIGAAAIGLILLIAFVALIQYRQPAYW